jgi:RNA polymerase sigma-70 factor (ECF subfamily)
MRGSTLQATEGNAGARIEGFELFYGFEHARLFGTLCLVTGDRAEAEDVMQEAFVRVWERWDQVSVLDDPAGYLYRTAFNVFRSRFRRAARAARRMVSDDAALDPFPAVEDRQDVLGALRKLAPRQRAAVVLTELMDLTSEDAAKILHVKPVTVRVLASQGRAAIRRDLEGHDE